MRESRKNGQKTFNHEKRHIHDGQRLQELRIISLREYKELINSADKQMVPLHKIRQKFLLGAQSCTLEMIENLPGKPTFLRVNVGHENVQFPSKLKILKDVTFN